MKKMILISICIILSGTFNFADHKVTYVSRTDGYYYGGVNTPEEVYEQVIWIGDAKLAYITDARRVVVDLKSKRMAVILTGMKKYAMTELPFKMAGILPDNLEKYLAGLQTQGEVKVLSGKKKIGKYNCNVYESSSWILYQGDKVNEIDTKFFTSTDFAFDLDQYNKLNKHLRVLRNYGPEFIFELDKLKGIPVYTESYFYPKGFAVKNTSEIKSTEELTPPAGIYEIPEGFEKVEKLSMQEFRTR